MKGILKSPFHQVVSGQIMIITFQGAKSGKIYATPVSYSREDERVTCFTHARWWKNFTNAAEVKLRIQGQDLAGYAEAISDDPERIAAGLHKHLLAVPNDARYYGVTLDADGQPEIEQVRRAAAEAVMIQISLKAPALDQEQGS
jgi:hypothetical protein